MKCNLSSKRILGGMLVVGAILAVCGAAAGMLFDEAQHMQARAAGMVCGMGTALALMGGGVLVWQRIVGTRRAAECALEANDERGQLIAFRAQNVLALAMVATVLVLVVVATVRGDWVYARLGALGCMLGAVSKGIALRLYGRRM
ncbi:MAG TPA: hypothetical protein IAC49_01960 [Candidatus Ventricola intestinavium]|nr:hypothetical protein [Candidatus Ventricola intestinavium]